MALISLILLEVVLHSDSGVRCRLVTFLVSPGVSVGIFQSGDAEGVAIGVLDLNGIALEPVGQGIEGEVVVTEIDREVVVCVVSLVEDV